MCLIVHKPEGKRIPQDVITSALKYNQDGVGVMSKGLVTKSAKMSEDRLLDTLDKVGDQECAVHLRMATHGSVNRKNCHPFRLRDGSWLMHNGVFSQYTRKGKDAFFGRSDTAEFVDKVCNAQLKSTGKLNESMLETLCGVSNKLAIMSPDGKFARYGETWRPHAGLYLSNDYAWDSPYYQTGKYGTYYGSKYKPYVFDDDADYSLYEREADVGASIVDSVYTFAECLFQQGPSIRGLTADDEQRYNDMFIEGTDAEEFLDGCSMRSIIAIYDELVRNCYIS